jgi:hypothetical protein
MGKKSSGVRGEVRVLDLAGRRQSHQEELVKGEV